jgi:leader peptidase (prepilin peptidase)/N-methyltransferase
MHVFWVIFLFLLGASVGSFLNVVIYRLPRGQSIVFPGSHCPSCGRGIRWYDNIPLLSWLALGGRCRFCKARISPRYLVVELMTALLVTGFYVAYYVFELLPGAGTIMDTWPMFTSHALLICGLLACSLVDIESYIVPLEVCWFNSIVGIAAATLAPWAFMGDSPASVLPRVGPGAGAAAVGGAVGLAIALLLVRRGVLQRSFLDASDKPIAPPGRDDSDRPAEASSSRAEMRKARKKKRKGPATEPKPEPVAVAATKAHGVNPRVEVLRELLFLLLPLGLALAGWMLVSRVEAVGNWWSSLAWGDGGNWFAPHLGALLAALTGYLVGGLWIWGTRILGTLGFGKEAMGMGDVHILAAVGAVAGWAVPSVVFFAAPVAGLIWALVLLFRRNQRELPYGPWLAAATLIVMAFHGPIMELLSPYRVLLEIVSTP